MTNFRTPYHAKMWKQRLTRKDLQLRLVSLAKRYVWSARMAQRGVSRALFHPEIASESNFDLESHFVMWKLFHSPIRTAVNLCTRTVWMCNWVVKSTSVRMRGNTKTNLWCSTRSKFACKIVDAVVETASTICSSYVCLRNLLSVFSLGTNHPPIEPLNNITI